MLPFWHSPPGTAMETRERESLEGRQNKTEAIQGKEETQGPQTSNKRSRAGEAGLPGTGKQVADSKSWGR